VTYETLALPMAKEASQESALGRVLVVHFDRLGDFGLGASFAA